MTWRLFVTPANERLWPDLCLSTPVFPSRDRQRSPAGAVSGPSSGRRFRVATRFPPGQACFPGCLRPRASCRSHGGNYLGSSLGRRFLGLAPRGGVWDPAFRQLPRDPRARLADVLLSRCSGPNKSNHQSNQLSPFHGPAPGPGSSPFQTGKLGPGGAAPSAARGFPPSPEPCLYHTSVRFATLSVSHATVYLLAPHLIHRRFRSVRFLLLLWKLPGTPKSQGLAW